MCKENNKILISDEFAQNLIKKTHLKFGHIRIKQIQLTLFPYFYNKNFPLLIKEFCNKCSVCIRNKSRVPSKFEYLSHLGPATKPFEYMSIDTIGGFAGNNSTKQYCHLLVDHFTRFAYAVTSKTQKAEDFTKLLKLVYNQGHKIENLLADQYTDINSIIFNTFLNQNGTNLLFTVVDCLFSNGLNERLNQILLNRLRCKVNESSENKKRPRSVLLQDCFSEYNNIIHSATRFSPIYLMTGQQSKIIKNFNFP